jgi:Transcriptional Coactivator p15 (PC4)
LPADKKSPALGLGKRKIATMTIAQEAPRRNSSRSNADEIEPILIAEWPINRGEIVRVSIKNYKGIWLIDVRKFFEGGDGEFNPSSKGITVSIRHLNRISSALTDALTVARQRGLIPSDREGE